MNGDHICYWQTLRDQPPTLESPLFGKCQTAYYPQFQALITSLLPGNMTLDYAFLVVQDVIYRFRVVFFIS